MYDGTCPTLDDLGQFLDEQLGPPRQAEIGTHVDTCRACQTVLETLTRHRAFDLMGLSTESLQGSVGHRVHDHDSTDEPEGIDDGANGRRRPDDERVLAPQVDGKSPLDADRTQFYVPPSGARADTSRTDTGLDPGLPQIASYEILEVLGEGGMGVVYKARQRGLNRLVAVKMVRGDRRGRPDQIARFRIEAEAVARLSHPNIVQIFDIGEADGVPFVSLELLEGGSLDHRLAGTPQPGRPASQLLITIAKAVQVAHDAGIIHRDLKPSNILFTEDGIPRITDFGLAKRLESDSRHTVSGQIMGSPSYMAPEQAKGRTRDVGPAADVYALGAILYEMLTGRPPFKGETPIETVRMVIDADVVPPSRLVPRVERDLETICLKCLAKEPDKRYSSAARLATDLERYRNGETIEARRASPSERAIKWSKRHPGRAASIVFAVFCLGTTLAAGVAYDQHLREQERQENVRIADSMTKNNKMILEAQEEFRQDKPATAREKLRDVQNETRKEPRLHALYDLAGSLLAQIERRLADDDAQKRDRARFETFLRLRDDALFYETQFTGLDLTASRKAAERAARAALAIFGGPGPRDVWVPNTLPVTYFAKEYEEVRESCYELLLVVAESVEQPKEGLRWLDAAARLSPATPAYHLARASCLERAGDAQQARREGEAGGRLSPSTPLDHFLLGRAAYHRKDWNAALAYFDLALQLRPDHFWSHCLSAICNLQLSTPLPAKADLNACLQSQREFAWLYVLRGFASYQVGVLSRSAAASLPTKGEMLRREAQAQLKACETDYAKALDLLARNPNDHLRYALLVNRGLLWLERRESDRAVADLQAAIRLDGNVYPAYESLAVAFERQNKPDKAVAAITRAIELQPKLAKLYRGRGGIVLRRKDSTAAGRAAALDDLEKAIRLDVPGYADVAARPYRSCPATLPGPSGPGGARRVQCSSQSGAGPSPGASNPPRAAAQDEAVQRADRVVRRPARQG